MTTDIKERIEKQKLKDAYEREVATNMCSPQGLEVIKQATGPNASLISPPQRKGVKKPKMVSTGTYTAPRHGMMWDPLTDTEVPRRRSTETL